MGTQKTSTHKKREGIARRKKEERSRHVEFFVDKEDVNVDSLTKAFYSWKLIYLIDRYTYPCWYMYKYIT